MEADKLIKLFSELRREASPEESRREVVGSGLIGGYEDSTLRPQGTTTRAEVASVLQRYLAN